MRGKMPQRRRPNVCSDAKVTLASTKAVRGNQEPRATAVLSAAVGAAVVRRSVVVSRYTMAGVPAAPVLLLLAAAWLWSMVLMRL